MKETAENEDKVWSQGLSKLKIRFKKHHPAARVPFQAREFDAGFDLCSIDHYTIQPLQRVLVRTGLSVEIPPGFYGQIAPRSGLALNKGIDTLAGVIDSGYRAEIGVILINFDVDFQSLLNPNVVNAIVGNPARFVIKPGDKIAQLLIKSCASVEWIEAEELSDSERNVSGFGSSGS